MIDPRRRRSPGRVTFEVLAGLMLLVAPAGCGGSPADGPETLESTADTIHVFFSRGEEIEAVVREVGLADLHAVGDMFGIELSGAAADSSEATRREAALLEVALRELLQGPSEAEQRSGLSSFFSAETAGSLQRISLDQNGRATVDFADFSRVIPNASTSFGSTMLLRELSATVFQSPAVRSVEYRFEGACEPFWNWLQRDCQVVDREEWTTEIGE